MLGVGCAFSDPLRVSCLGCPGYKDRDIKARPLVPLPLQSGWQLYVYKDSFAEQRQQWVIDSHRQALQRLEAFFDRRLQGPIHLVIHPDSNNSVFRFCQVYPESQALVLAVQPGRWAYETQNPGHKLTHLFTGRKATGEKVTCNELLGEGLAEYLGGGRFDPHLCYTDRVQSLGGDARMGRFVDGNHLDGQHLRATAGSLVKFLVEQQADGRSRVLRLLEETQTFPWAPPVVGERFTKMAEAIFEKSWLTLMQEWNEALAPYWAQNITLDDRDRNAINRRLRHWGYPEPSRIRYLGYSDFLELCVELEDGRRLLVKGDSDNDWVIRGKVP